MLIGLGVLTLVALLRAMLCFLAPIWFLGLPNAKTQSPVQVPKRNTRLWKMELRKPVGSANFYRNCMLCCLGVHWSTVITLVQFICPPIQFNTNARSTLRSISISSVSGLPLMMFEFSMFPPPLSLLTSSPRAFRPLCFKNFAPVFICAKL